MVRLATLLSLVMKQSWITFSTFSIEVGLIVDSKRYLPKPTKALGTLKEAELTQW